MANKNYLAGMRCPACGSVGPFYIGVSCTVKVADDRIIWEGGDPHWSDGSDCICAACNHLGLVLEFKEKVQDDGK